MPLRHLMKQHADRAATGTVLDKLDSSLAFAQTIADAGAGYFQANPAVKERLKKIAEQDRNYVSHEYLNASWDVMPFSNIAEQTGRRQVDLRLFRTFAGCR